jgi:toxin-antitoxin system PIN domain toxin
MITVDTNILLYAVNQDDPRSAQACRAIEQIANDHRPWSLSWSIVYEFLRVATHPRVFSSPLNSGDAWSFVSELMSQSRCIMLTETTAHRSTLEQCIEDIPRIRGNLVHDLYIAVLMREHGIPQLLTEDHDFRLFPWIEPLSLESLGS